jgi:KaiC/GvpD/RAD55 family RecA-like ATPase
MDNMQKYANYREQKGRLLRAIKNGFYLEAVFIEYAILEDRSESLLRHCEMFNPDKHNTLAKKLNRISELHRNKSGLVKKYIPEDVIGGIREWKNERNRLIHALLKQELHTEDLEKIALDGQTLANGLSNKINSLKRAIAKQQSVIEDQVSAT